MRRVGDQLALGVKHRAGEVEPLLDVDGLRRVAQRLAHLLGDRHVEVVEHFQQDGICGLAEHLALARRRAAKHEVVPRRHLQAPAGLDHDGLVRLDDERRSRQARAWLEHLAHIDRRIVPRPAGIEARAMPLSLAGLPPPLWGRAGVRGGSSVAFVLPLTPTLSP